MHLTHLTATDFLGIRDIDVDLGPITLFCGPNGAAKSSIADAVMLVLTGELSRVTLKKDAGQLVRRGQKSARIDLVEDRGRGSYSAGIGAAGKLAVAPPAVPALPYVLQGQRIAGMKPDERRAFFFDLLGVKMNREAVAHELHQLGCQAPLVARILPLLRSGFEAGATEAKGQATAAKALWRAATGENYGSDKAESWQAPRVVYVDGTLEQSRDALGIAEGKLAEAQQVLGRQSAQADGMSQMRNRIAQLQQLEAQIVRRRDKLRADEASLKEAQDKLTRAQALAGVAPRSGLVHDLATAYAWASTFVPEGLHDNAEHRDGVAALEAYEREHGPVGATDGDATARQQLPALKDAADLMARVVQNSMRDLRAAEDAQAEMQRLQAEVAAAGALPSLDDARAKVQALGAERDTIAKEVERLRALRDAATGAEAKTKEAAQHHADVQAWAKIGDALSPAGIPATLLARALKPLNERLEQSAADTGWPLVALDGDMAVTYCGQAYALCSESEQWRADAMLAEAVSHLSGVKLLMLDRFDVLDLTGRGEAIGWMQTLAENGEVDTALLFGTLKAPPAGLGDSVVVHWVEGGRVVAPEAMREAA